MRDASPIEQVSGAQTAAIVARAIARTLFRADHARSARFPTTYCSQCGRAFGAGEEGYSDCEQHAHLIGRD